MTDHDNDTPNLPPSMLADLAAISRGEALPAREWHERPWKVGEPVWAHFVAATGVVVTVPGRVSVYVPVIPGSGMETALVEFQVESFTGEEIALPDGVYELRGLIPRIVPGEVW